MVNTGANNRENQPTGLQESPEQMNARFDLEMRQHKTRKGVHDLLSRTER